MVGNNNVIYRQFNVFKPKIRIFFIFLYKTNDLRYIYNTGMYTDLDGRNKFTKLYLTIIKMNRACYINGSK